MANYNQRYAFVTAATLDPSTGGGPASALLGLMEALAHKGKRVGLVTPTTLPLPQGLTQWWFNRHLVTTLQNLEIDVAVGIGPDGHRFASARRGYPFVAYLQGVAAHAGTSAVGPRRAHLKRIARREQRNATLADLVIVTGEFWRDAAAAHYNLPVEKIAVVPTGIDADSWPQRPLPANSSPRALCVSHLATQNGLESLLKAWIEVRRHLPDAILRVVGDGPADRFKAMLSRVATGAGVEFAGALRQSALKEEYARTDLFCVPAEGVGLGMACLEAMATGRPVVGTDSGLLPEIVGQSALLVPPGDPEALALALRTLLADRKQQEEMAARARTRAMVLSWEAAARRFGELLAGL